MSPIVPAPHALHALLDVEPSLGLTLPFGHEMQKFDLGLVLYLPLRHPDTQAALAADELLPVGHLRQRVPLVVLSL